MRKNMKLAVIGALLALGVGVANAQTTNIVLVANISLTGFQQSSDSSATPVRITNKDIFAALNANGNSFGKNAKLVIVNSDANGPTAQVREKNGTDTTITDISGNLSISVDADVTGKGGVHYDIVSFTFVDNPDSPSTSFTVSGFATVRHGRITGRGIGTLDDQVLGAAVQVSGSGTVGGNTAVFKGTISAGGPKAEID
jgi:hypothetical protein